MAGGRSADLLPLEAHMHPNPAFRKTNDATNITFARDRSFGTLSINADPSPLLAHIPFNLSPDGKRLEAHLVRSNPIARALKTSQKAVMSITGDDSYISPDWYGVEDFVPTWNYVAVHLRGTLTMLPQDDLRGIIERLSEIQETKLLPKPIWKLDKLSEDLIAKMFKMIVPIALEIDQIDGTWKLAQNKGEEARLNAASHVPNANIAALMRNPPQ